MTLDEISRKYGTDKGYFHHYTPLYESYLSPLRNEKIRLAELGFANGGSAWMWHDYFPHGDFWYVDIDPNYKKVPPRSVLDHRDQADPEGFELATENGLFDVIIDDASHINDKTVASYKLWWHGLKPGGLYVVEDVFCSYREDFGGNPDPGTDSTVMGFLKKLADEVNRKSFAPEYRLGFDIEWVHFYRNIVFIRRADYIIQKSGSGTSLPDQSGRRAITL